MRRSVTLIELLVVVMVLGILVALILPNFTKTRERAYDKEAIASLELIRHAEQMYRLESGHYFPDNVSYETDEAVINENLRLNLNNRYWDYQVSCTDLLDLFNCSSYEAFAARDVGVAPTGYDRNWTINATNLTCYGDGCPPGY